LLIGRPVSEREMYLFRKVSGDRIGVLVDHDTGGSLSFFRNGEDMGEAFR